MQSLYVEGNSALHRLSPRAKILALFLLGFVLFLSNNLLLLAVVMLLTVLIYRSVGMPVKESAARLKPIFLTIAFVALVTLIVNPWHQAFATLLRLTGLMLFAAAVTATTTIAQFMDEITTLVRPLERTGWVRADDVGLAVGLVLRFVPEIIARYHAISEAHAARGLKLRPTTILTPLIILTLRDADNVAAAIDARGIRRHVS
ncbi:biotin transport system permease protein [Rhizobium sp. BK275]|jgi:biotin transport system permease protein|uniref:energy-coupling factor transporter transmembrane component T family protein n=1 Tax=Rhizobium sp. BK275 TaxID=2587077 RepID=UPI001607ED5A|nr:energy-coupling factor transporter transmembrane protein EcfT [Rhizobium sp. BK275]MBB3392431.1 biotin transport system permease protein [Rhizobium sp. BK275]